MTSNVALPIAAAVVTYTLFGTFNAQAGGRIDAALSSTIFNGLAALISLGVVLWQWHAHEAGQVTAQASGVVYSLLAGVAVGGFSILLIGIYGRGGELSYVFPAIYGGAIALTAVIGWLLLGDTVDLLRVVGVGAIVVGIGLLAAS
jgi:bacterial/archaeal transporter family protein